MTPGSRRTVDVDGARVEISDDASAPPALAWWAVLRTRVIDEITEAPPRAPARFSRHAPARCVPRIGSDGLCGLVARPADVASALVTPGALKATIVLDGYLPQVLDAAIDAARRTLPLGAPLNVRQLTIAPPEDAARPQFRAGRGVMIERPVPAAAEQFLVDADDPAALPPANRVDLDAPVTPARPAAAHVAGVPLRLPDQRLHRAGTTRLYGRVLRQATTGSTPIAAPLAEIGLAGTWWTLAEIVAAPAAPHPARIVSFAAPLARAHAAATPVERLSLTPDGVARRLAAPARAGDDGVMLSGWTGLAAAGGDLLQLEAGNVTERELVVTAAVESSGDPGQPARVRLRTPLAQPHADACVASRVAVAATPVGNTEREAIAGDAVLYLDALAGLAADDVLRVGGAAPDAEARFVRCLPVFDGAFHFPVAIAADGSFALPPLARAAQVQIQVAHTGHPLQQPILVVPEPGTSGPALSILITP